MHCRLGDADVYAWLEKNANIGIKETFKNVVLEKILTKNLMHVNILLVICCDGLHNRVRPNLEVTNLCTIAKSHTLKPIFEISTRLSLFVSRMHGDYSLVT